ncbi:hypothetical protein U0E23_18825 [Burkholderia stagnalis]|uniref:hypothetical protein n=1 Tax=Burkholderia stagnalis TaxID=1503054 RepID=UPI002AB33E06|nr:hypothetical protein [Burkholderia stagnalis]MDY7804499.1 hypothetical protein [Burkholderia stagnalis]
MQVLPNRKIVARDTLTGVLSAHARSRHIACCRCTQCGFIAFRALEHCPACGRWNWPFEPLAEQPRRALADHPMRPVDAWDARVARFFHHVAVNQPRASTAPMLSLVTLFLLFGGYVGLDRMCRLDPVCRAQDVSEAPAIAGDLHAQAELAAQSADLPVLPPPVYPFHATDPPRVAADAGSGPGAEDRLAGRPKQDAPPVRAPAPARTQNAIAARAPVNTLAARPCALRSESGCARMRAAALRTAEPRDRRDTAPARHAQKTIRRVSAHPEPARRSGSHRIELARLYRGH